MSQLPLALELREGHALDNFHAGPNGAALATVDSKKSLRTC